MIHDELLPDESRIFAWIEEVVSRGVRRPGYAADRWAERWIQDRFHDFGLEAVRAEPVETPYWEPRAATLHAIDADGTVTEIPCFPLPFALPGEIEAPLVAFDAESSDAASGAIALCDAPLMRVPHSWYSGVATWRYDPDGSFEGTYQILPFGPLMQDATRPAMDAGAAAFIGTLTGYPGTRAATMCPTMPTTAPSTPSGSAEAKGSGCARCSPVAACALASASTLRRARSPLTTS